MVGNLTHTGQHGVFFQKENISQADYLDLVFDALLEIKKDLKINQNKTIRAILFKDYFQDDTIHFETNFFKTNKLHKVTVQPNMILRAQSNWLSFKV